MTATSSSTASTTSSKPHSLSPSGSGLRVLAPTQLRFRPRFSPSFTGLRVTSLSGRPRSSIMAAFLDAQLIGFNRKTRLTVLAPADGAIEDYMRNATDYSVIFRQHVLNRLLPWQEMVDLEDGSVLSTFQDGFSVNMVKMGDEPVLNDVPVALQDLYVSRFLVVYGLNRLLTPQQQQMVYQEEEPLGYHDDDDEAGNASSFTDWHVTSVADHITPHFQLDDYH